jgi:hypothetical protein
MIIELHQDRKVIFEKYSLEMSLTNELISNIEGCFVKEYGEYCRVYFKDNIALFEENYLCGDAAFYIHGDIWNNIQNKLNLYFKDTQLFIANILREYFPVNIYQVSPKGIRYY